MRIGRDRRCTRCREIMPRQGDPHPLQPFAFAGRYGGPSQSCLCLCLMVVFDTHNAKVPALVHRTSLGRLQSLGRDPLLISRGRLDPL